MLRAPNCGFIENSCDSLRACNREGEPQEFRRSNEWQQRNAERTHRQRLKLVQKDRSQLTPLALAGPMRWPFLQAFEQQYSNAVCLTVGPGWLLPKKSTPFRAGALIRFLLVRYFRCNAYWWAGTPFGMP